jgi:23S rRNA (cytosine1962-C5)-methyltransferase
VQALLDAIAQAQAPSEAGRIFHGRGGLYAGCEHWTLDYFAPVWLLTSFQPTADDELAAIHAALQARWAQLQPGQPLNWVFQERRDTQAQTRLMAGSVPEPHWACENGAQFLVHLMRGFNHGLFLDMAEGRRWVHELAQAQPGLRALNLFAYTCAFSVVALKGGASHVTNVDMASGALAIGQKNHQLNALASRASFLPHDIFSSWGKITRGGPYDLVILDPPSHQKGSFVAEKDYPRLMRRLEGLLAPGGHALLCLNSPKLGPAWLQEQMTAHAPELQFLERLRNPPAFADAQTDRALKVLVYRAPGPAASPAAASSTP